MDLASQRLCNFPLHPLIGPFISKFDQAYHRLRNPRLPGDLILSKILVPPYRPEPVRLEARSGYVGGNQEFRLKIEALERARSAGRRSQNLTIVLALPTFFLPAAPQRLVAPLRPRLRSRRPPPLPPPRSIPVHTPLLPEPPLFPNPVGAAEKSQILVQ